MTGARLHALKMPDRTECGITGRVLERNAVLALLDEADVRFLIGYPFTCRACLAAVARHGLPLPWPDALPERGQFMRGKRLRRDSQDRENSR